MWFWLIVFGVGFWISGFFAGQMRGYGKGREDYMNEIINARKEKGG